MNFEFFGNSFTYNGIVCCPRDPTYQNFALLKWSFKKSLGNAIWDSIISVQNVLYESVIIHAFEEKNRYLENYYVAYLFMRFR